MQVKFAGPTSGAASSREPQDGRPLGGTWQERRQAPLIVWRHPQFCARGWTHFEVESSPGRHAGPLFRGLTHGRGYGSCLAGVASSCSLTAWEPLPFAQTPLQAVTRACMRTAERSGPSRAPSRASLSSAVLRAGFRCGRPTQRGVGAATGLGSGKGGAARDMDDAGKLASHRDALSLVNRRGARRVGQFIEPQPFRFAFEGSSAPPRGACFPSGRPG